MLDHVTIGVRDVEQSKKFYDRALAPLGIARLYAEGERFAGYGVSPKAFFWIGTRATRRPARISLLRRETAPPSSGFMKRRSLPEARTTDGLASGRTITQITMAPSFSTRTDTTSKRFATHRRASPAKT